MTDLYAVLGVSSDASAAELRRAYLARARALHPDRWSDRSDAERRKAERAMQDVNEAWRVLGDPVERARYDRPTGPTSASRPTTGSRPTPPPRTGPPRSGPPRPPRRPVDGVAPDPVGASPPSTLASVVAGLAPYLALVAVGLGIFVVTAFAGGDDGPSEEVPDELTCVQIPASGVPERVGCDGEHDGYLVAEVSLARACGEGRRYVIPGGETALCLSDTPPPEFPE